MPTTHLPPIPEQIKRAYLELQYQLDTAIAAHIETFFATSLNCRPGCCDCCIPFSILSLEAACIQEQKKESPPKTERAECCSHLHEGRCSIYQLRPFICRSQGLPIGYVDTENSTIEVSCCPLNFAEDYAFRAEELFYLDSHNAELARLNALYCNEVGIDPYRRIPLADCR